MNPVDLKLADVLSPAEIEALTRRSDAEPVPARVLPRNFVRARRTPRARRS